jgi:tripartite-type tricarboxylate transporter receptor subunit TctC
LALALFACGLAGNQSAAQVSPGQPIRIIVGVPAGGLGDLAARIMAQRLNEIGHTAIVENRLGGNGLIATEAVTKSPPDGHTLVMGNHSTLGTLPHLTKVGYDPLKDLAPVTLMLAVPNVLVVKPALPAASLTELIAYGKANRLTNATQGIGASSHLIGEQFKQLTGVNLTHVHYRGAPAALQDVVGSHVDMMFDVVALTREHALAGRVRALAVLAAQRNPVLPNVPTSAELGLAALEGGAWFGLLAPAGTPRPVIDWLNAEAGKAFAVPEVRQRLAKQGLDLPLGTPEAFAAFIAAENRRWGAIIRQGGIKIEGN